MQPLEGASEFPAPDRYSRQELFAPLGSAGQQKLSAAHIAIVGVGATGAAAASLLARAGVGRLTLIDRDFVEPSNLQRQVLFDEADALAALPKAEAARRKIAALNSSVCVTAHIADFTPANAQELVGDAMLLLDGTDNFETRYLINDLAVSEGLPWIYSAALGAQAAGMNILPKPAGHLTPSNSSLPPAWLPTACLACIFDTPPQGDIATCDTAGILGTAVQLAAAWQVTEALKFLSGNLAAMRRTFLSHDLWTGERAEIAADAPDPACSVCGAREFAALRGDGRPHITLCGRNSVQIHEHHRPVNLTALAERLQPLGKVTANGMLLRFELAPYRLTVFPDGRALVQGTTDPAIARSLYARYLGV
jgi:molybdopterin/thiamine biosynthesis adenylyltransferase